METFQWIGILVLQETTRRIWSSFYTNRLVLNSETRQVLSLVGICNKSSFFPLFPLFRLEISSFRGILWWSSPHWLAGQESPALKSRESYLSIEAWRILSVGKLGQPARQPLDVPIGKIGTWMSSQGMLDPLESRRRLH